MHSHYLRDQLFLPSSVLGSSSQGWHPSLPTPTTLSHTHTNTHIHVCAFFPNPHSSPESSVQAPGSLPARCKDMFPSCPWVPGLCPLSNTMTRISRVNLRFLLRTWWSFEGYSMTLLVMKICVQTTYFVTRSFITRVKNKKVGHIGVCPLNSARIPSSS